MTILSAHPAHATIRERIWTDYRSYRFQAPIRRIAGLSTTHMHIDVLRNHGRIVRQDWDASISIGSLTIAIVRKNGRV